MFFSIFSLMTLCLVSSFSYVIPPDEFPNENVNQPFSLNFPLYHNRMIRTTKFPRIGRSAAFDPDDLTTLLNLYAINGNDENEQNKNVRTSNWFNQRSVLFPRIGRRAINPFFEANTLLEPWHVSYDPYAEMNVPEEDRSARNRREKSNISM